MTIAIILAAGKASRMKKKINKAFVLLNKKEIIYYCLKTFQKHKKIDKIIIVTAKKDLKRMQTFLNKYRFNKVEAVVEGGIERQYSAHNGLKFIQKNFEGVRPLRKGSDPFRQNIVLFHNAGNPFVAPLEISQIIDTAKKHGAAVVGIPAKDTIKKVDKNGFIVKTLLRQNLWAAQTPQAIQFSLASRAFEKATADNFLGTDDVSLVERIGGKVKVVLCSERNFKITTPNDLQRAELIVKHKYN